jgi:hypothetical protein
VKSIDPVDWQRIAEDVGSLSRSADTDRGWSEHGGTHLARLALEHLLDAEVYRSAVDHYVKGAPGSELARSLLWLVHPWEGMQRCHEVYSIAENLETKRRAVELLRVVADRRAVSWVSQYLQDSDEQIQFWGAGILEQLLLSDLVQLDECLDLLGDMANHANPKVQELALNIERGARCEDSA